MGYYLTSRMAADKHAHAKQASKHSNGRPGVGFHHLPECGFSACYRVTPQWATRCTKPDIATWNATTREPVDVK
ncbi:hypothetical protein ZWY2020_030088 [Hordeum vulgare]|nr:hypothetical protein ZWY2020_030088 [Hordeum vulgare]